MKLNFNQSIKALGGEPLKDKDENGVLVDIMLKIVVVNALLAPIEKETGIKKFERSELAAKVYNAEGEADLTIDEVALIKKRIGEHYGPILVGPIWHILEGDKLEKDSEKTDEVN